MIRRQTQYVCTIFNFQKKINQIIRLVKHLIGISSVTENNFLIESSL
jgi:hypothetical protein